MSKKLLRDIDNLLKSLRQGNETNIQVVEILYACKREIQRLEDYEFMYKDLCK